MVPFPWERASGQGVAGAQLFVPRKMNCVFVRGLAAVCASKCECLLSVLLSAIQRKMMLGKLLRGRRCIWEHLPARRSRIGLELGCKSDLLQNYASGALLAMKSLSMSEALPMGGTRKERRSRQIPTHGKNLR